MLFSVNFQVNFNQVPNHTQKWMNDQAKYTLDETFKD